MKQYLLFLFFPAILFCQFDRSGFIGSNNGKIYIINDINLEVYDYNQKLIDNFPIDSVPLNFGFPKSFQSVFIKDKLYISSVGGGMMYTIVNDTLKRIDNSYNHKMTIESSAHLRGRYFLASSLYLLDLSPRLIKSIKTQNL